MRLITNGVQLTVGQRGLNQNQQLRDKILRKRGLVKAPGKTLVEAAPKSELNSNMARLVESHFDNTPIRVILKHYSVSEIYRRTGVSRSAIGKWKKKLQVSSDFDKFKVKNENEQVIILGEPQYLDDFLKWQAPPLVPIVGKGVMYEGSKIILYGKYKTMKSMLAIRFALSVAFGENWLGFTTTSSGKNILYLQLEIPAPLLQRRLQAMKAVPTDKVIIWTEHNIAIDTDEGMAKIEEAIEDYYIEILILDPIYMLTW